ncbi:Zinc finger protein [Wickerhamomyces ciferrii]|uniref:Zinc finger protein n=1 Tax=Wickerhamomyces ciferrii (strain ATCC 14091 / BCRC 22168 / CBS 111 / JCM 3599 / NBRC 0793 / NRRL Y-1031 F-60-10) TaxID=1206466 RepID=K0KGF6_WICCF|nr:Zinc finger protein [Wickerhamomyces ciferrii]CCH42056.1 Zinc finger protein [Wickerhamomyces ciferrii]
MKSDWHRYNLKRRVANLPAIDEDLFNEKVQKLSLEESNEETQGKTKKLSKKDQRRQEKEALLEKKKQLLEIARQNMLKSMSSDNEIKQDEVKQEVQKTEQEVQKEDESNDQELTEEQQAERVMEEKLKNKVEIPKEVCLFCNKKFPYFEEALNHMFKHHGFYIPEQKYLVDKEGLVKYMAEKVGLGNLCFVCSFQGRSLEAARAHMLSKNHCKIPYESEDEKMEISEFYDFTSTYDDYKQAKEGEANDGDDDGEWEDVEEASGDEDEEDEELPQEVSYNDGIELHLPSGVKVGHRSLARYYRQNLRPEVVLSEGQGTVISAESRHLATVHDRKQLLEKKRVWKNEKHHQDRDDRRAAKFINNQPHYRDQLLQ